eukprot:6988190-Prymnesium_polylepis.2
MRNRWPKARRVDLGPRGVGAHHAVLVPSDWCERARGTEHTAAKRCAEREEAARPRPPVAQGFAVSPVCTALELGGAEDDATRQPHLARRRTAAVALVAQEEGGDGAGRRGAMRDA